MRMFIDILKSPKKPWNLYEPLPELKKREPTWFSLKEEVEEKGGSYLYPAKSSLFSKSFKYRNNIVRKRGLY